MRARAAGTIVNVTSMGGKIYTPLGGWYHGTKFALEGISDCLRLEVRPFGIDVVVIEPGGIEPSGAPSPPTSWKVSATGATPTGPGRRRAMTRSEPCPRSPRPRHRRRHRQGRHRPPAQDPLRDGPGDASPRSSPAGSCQDRAMDALVTMALRSAAR